jgi:hypothetical protein
MAACPQDRLGGAAAAVCPKPAQKSNRADNAMRHGSSTLDLTATRQHDLLRGLGLRLELPAFVVKYGGSALWGAMVFFLVALAGSRLSRPGIVRISAAIAIIVEAGPFARARRLSADAGGRAAAGPHLLGLEHGGLWRGDHCSDGARSVRSRVLAQRCMRQLSIKSLTRSFARGGFSAFIACLAASSAMRMISFMRAVIFSRIDLSVVLMSPPKSGY